MNHSFIKSSEKDRCAICKQGYIAHSPAATCEACSKIGEVDLVYGNMLLCKNCQVKEKIAWDASQKPEKVVERVDALNVAIEKAREIDNSIRYNGDFFNAATISLAELKRAIDNDNSIENKHEAFQNEVIERIEKFKTRIFELDEEKFKVVAEQQAHIGALREFGNSLRAEIRERLKLSDANYTPHNIIKAPKISKPKASPMDRLIEAYALMHGISKDEAKEAIDKGKN